MSQDTSFSELHASVPTDVLVNVFEQAPARLERVLVDLTEDQVWERSRGPGRWSTGEIVCHLADSEAVAAVRFRIARCHSDATLVTYDQDAFADELGYRDRKRDLDASLQMFAALRKCTASLMKSWGPPVWNRTASHPEWGSLTLRQLLELYADHGERHLDQILENRMRQHRPAALASILSGRLVLTAVPIEAGSRGVP